MSIRVKYRLETSGNIESVANKIASDQSTGTFTELPGETEVIKLQCAARVEKIELLPKTDTSSFPNQDDDGPYNVANVIISYPLEAVGTDIAALQTIAIGGVFAVRGLTGIRVLDIEFPQAYSCHPGPQFGISGTRELLNLKNGPIFGSIIKPSLGISPKDTAQIVSKLCYAGIDFIKDDEKLMSPAYSSLADRVKAIMPVIHDFQQKTGKRVMYAFGISAGDPDTMMRNHDLVVEAGGCAGVININSIGVGGMTFLRKRSKLCLHAHRNGWDMLTRHPTLGMEFKAYQKIWRLLGVDQFQINGIDAKYWEPDESFIKSFHDLNLPIFSKRDCPLPVVCSGQWGGQAYETYKRNGRNLDLMYLSGGGIHGHPMGMEAGVKAIRQAWTAASEGIDLNTYAKEHIELKTALQKWG